MSVQVRSGRDENSSGPGCRPYSCDRIVSAEEEVRIEIAILEARYNGYVFAPVFAQNH